MFIGGKYHLMVYEDGIYIYMAREELLAFHRAPPVVADRGMLTRC
jgi:hypothetical protein